MATAVIYTGPAYAEGFVPLGAIIRNEAAATGNPGVIDQQVEMLSILRRERLLGKHRKENAGQGEHLEYLLYSSVSTRLESP